jgi:hypothetical protein
MVNDPIAMTLEALAPSRDFQPEWEQVMLRAEPRGRQAPTRWSRRKTTRLTVALAVVIAALIPLAALGDTGQLWFLHFPIVGQTSAPTDASSTSGGSSLGPVGVAPAVSPVSVQTGSWNGAGWELDAFVGTSGDLCFGIAPSRSAHGDGGNAALACARIYGVPTPTSAPADSGGLPLDITYLMNGRTNDLPPYIAGPVVGTARTVAIYFSDGEVVRTPTFEAPPSLGSVRFYASPIPDTVATTYLQAPPRTVPAFTKIVGLDDADNIVACLRTPMMNGGVPPSACR